jgi:hypothetical protein
MIRTAPLILLAAELVELVAVLRKDGELQIISDSLTRYAKDHKHEPFICSADAKQIAKSAVIWKTTLIILKTECDMETEGMVAEEDLPF